ncbi:MAG: hypothetical protein ACAF41_22535 [Leptolyngbya sp. BL-A-14]
MKTDNAEEEDELRAEYNLKKLRVRRLGAERRSFGGAIVRLEPDVAAMFPSAEAVNEALRFLARVTQENQARLLESQPSHSITSDG